MQWEYKKIPLGGSTGAGCLNCWTLLGIGWTASNCNCFGGWSPLECADVAVCCCWPSWADFCFDDWVDFDCKEWVVLDIVWSLFIVACRSSLGVALWPLFGGGPSFDAVCLPAFGDVCLLDFDGNDSLLVAGVDDCLLDDFSRDCWLPCATETNFSCPDGGAASVASGCTCETEEPLSVLETGWSFEAGSPFPFPLRFFLPCSLIN